MHAADFASERLIVYDRRSPMTAMVLRFLLEEGVFPPMAMTVDYLTIAKEMVLGGLGVAVLPRWAVRLECEAGQLCAVSLGKGGLTRAWAWRRWRSARNPRPSRRSCACARSGYPLLAA